MIGWLKSLLKDAPVVPAAPAARAPMKINPMAPYTIGDDTPVAVAERYEPPAGVIPSDRKAAALAMDATPYDYLNQSSSMYAGAFFKGYQYLAMLSQLPEYRKISETIAKEMTRKWVKLKAVGDEDKSEKIKYLEDALIQHHIQACFRKSSELDGFFGRGQIYIDVKTPSDVPAQDVPGELETPLLLNKAKIKMGSLIGFRVIEPVWTYPSAYNADNPLSPNYYRPLQWFVMGKTVHASRLILFVSRPVPDLLKASYNFGGLSMSQLAEPYINNWLRTRDSVSDLVHSFSISGIKTNMGAVLTNSLDPSIVMRAKMFNQMRDNRGVFMIDKETEDFFQFNTPLSGLDALQAQSQEQMASVSSIPLVKLLGITPSGLNASADGEIRVFYDHIHSEQEKQYRGPLTTILQILQLDKYGEIDPEITFEFEPLYQLDEMQKATIRKTDADTDALLIGAGAISPDDSRERLIADPENGYVALEANAVPDDADDNEDEADA